MSANTSPPQINTPAAATHTPPPWSSLGDIVVSDSGSVIARIEPVADLPGCVSAERALGRQAANSNVIAAAPELLASCKELRATLAAALSALERTDGSWARFLNECDKAGIRNGIGAHRANAAIRKAEGSAAR